MGKNIMAGWRFDSKGKCNICGDRGYVVTFMIGKNDGSSACGRCLALAAADILEIERDEKKRSKNKPIRPTMLDQKVVSRNTDRVDCTTKKRNLHR
jgi:hypothetical protein